MKNIKNQETYNSLLKILATKDFPKSKLLTKLENKGSSREEAENAISKAIKNNIYDELNYIELEIKNCMKKNLSPKYINLKLKQVQIDFSEEKIIDYFHDHSINTTDQIENLLQIKLPSNLLELPKDLKIKEINKAARYLASKGHEIDIYDYFPYLI